MYIHIIDRLPTYDFWMESRTYCFISISFCCSITATTSKFYF